MSENTGGENSPPPDTGGLAMDMAMEEARANPSLQSHVAAFLDDQRSLIAVQKHHLHKQLLPTLAEKWLGVLLRAATAVVGIAFAGALGFMIWEASRSNGLLIESFTVPPDLAARGLSGQVFSNLLLDKLTELQDQTQSTRPPQSYSNNWNDDIRVEIPQTGVSIGELRRFLREWLGNDTHITGEVWHSSAGLALVARAPGSKGDVVTGAEADLDTVIQKVAENVYRVTQPYRYANYLDRPDYRSQAVMDYDGAEKIYRQLVTHPNPVERAWAWNGLGNLAYTARSDAHAAIGYYRRAVAIDPKFNPGHSALSYIYTNILSHAEQGLAEARLIVLVNPQSSGPRAQPLLGEWADHLRGAQAGLNRPNTRTTSTHDTFRGGVLWALAGMHDAKGARAWQRTMPPPETPVGGSMQAWFRVRADAALEDWRAVLVSEPLAEKIYLKDEPGFDNANFFARELRPMLALAKVMTGDIASGEALAASFPADCYNCLRARGRIAAARKQAERADMWFSRAVAFAPSVPLAYAEWGKALLERGDADGAIAKFQLATQKGPKFADPLEGWGEALMAKSQSHLALEKFAAAEKFAPNWKRLHRKWGEALTYVGNKDEARKHFARAAAL